MLRLGDPWSRKRFPGEPHRRFVRRLGRTETSTIYLAERVEGEFAGMFPWIVKSYPDVETPATLRDAPQIEAIASHDGTLTQNLVGAARVNGYWLLCFRRLERFRPISRLLARAPVRRLQLACVVEQLALAFMELHDHHIAYRNVGPDSVLYQVHEASGTIQIRLFDFGKARFVAGEYAHLVAHPSGGPSRYAAPEQRAGAETGTAADIYATARLAYELWTGDREVATWRRHPPVRATSWPGLPRRLAVTLGSALSLWPTARPTAREVYAAALAARLTCYPRPDGTTTSEEEASEAADELIWRLA